MSSTVVQHSDFNTANVSFTPIKVLESGGKQAYLNYSSNGSSRSLTMQTASMAVPYGMNVYDKAGPIKYSVDLSFRGYEDDSPTNKVHVFYNTMQALDEFMVQQGVKNCQAWFKAKLSEETVRAFYTPIIRVSKDANGNPKPYPPTLKVSLKQKKDSESFDISCYDATKQPYEGVPLKELLVKGAQATVLVQCTGVWFAGSKFGLSWKGVQLRIDKLPDSIRGFAFADEDAQPSSRSQTAPANKSRVAPAPVKQQQEEVEDEVDDDEAFSAAPATTQQQKPSVLAAVMQQTMDDEPEDNEPVSSVQAKKTTVTAGKVIKTVKPKAKA